MGTRGAWGFRIDGVDKVEYNHFDSYPTGLGKALAEEVTQALKRPSGLDEMRAAARDLRMVDPRSTPTAEDKTRLVQHADRGVASGSLDDWYVLLRQRQGQLQATLKGGIAIEALKFLAESLWCEWAYIINLDDGAFEIYRGFQTAQHDAGRYSSMPPVKAGYWPVRLVATIPFADLMAFDMAAFHEMLDGLEDQEASELAGA